MNINDIQNKPKKVTPFKSALQLAQSYAVARILKAQRDQIEEINRKKRQQERSPIQIDELCKKCVNRLQEKLNNASQSDKRIELEVELVELKKHMEILIYSFKTASTIVNYKTEYVAIMFAAIKSMLDEFDFLSDSSVTSNDAHIKESYGDTGYSELRQVNLLYHTIHVFKAGVDRIAPRGEVIEQGYKDSLMASLLHDFGKSEKVKVAVGQYYHRGSIPAAHFDVSELYVNLILKRQLTEMFVDIAKRNRDVWQAKQDFEDIMKDIATLVKNHHCPIGAKQDSDHVDFVRQADYIARRGELEWIRKHSGASQVKSYDGIIDYFN
ncbi:hypothetical protein ACPF04_06555 [Campylobacter sp. MOP51]|uniref:hypothetical protein n=1 Tax=Campylobacter canis TaxID=3378588 RepID=UPI003C40A189